MVKDRLVCVHIGELPLNGLIMMTAMSLNLSCYVSMVLLKLIALDVAVLDERLGLELNL